MMAPKNRGLAAVVAAAVLAAAVSAVGAPQEALRFVLVEESELMADRASTGGLSWVDVDGDGDDDVFSTNGYDVSRSPAVPQPNRLYENVDGRLVELRNPISEDPGFSSGSAWADFDNDGLIDVFVPNQREQDNFLYRNRGGFGFERLVDAPPSHGGGLSFSATWGDIDGDGFVELFVGNGGLSGPGRDVLFRNVAGEAFRPLDSGPVVEGEGQSGGATFVDYDLDGDVDLFVPGRPTKMFRNDGKGDFGVDAGSLFVNEPSPGDISVSGAWGDFDNDGDFDLFQVFVGGDTRRLYVNEGAGRFVRAERGDATRERSDAFHSMWVDLDNDGFLDLVVANWGAPPHAYLNRGGASLDRVRLGALEERAWYASMVAASDFDGDGDVDLAVGNWPNQPGEGEANLLYRNEGPVGNWIALRLEGTRSNRSAIGARVHVTIEADPPRSLMRDVRSQDGWRSQSSLEVLVGLAEAIAASSVRVIWPSGIVQEIGRVRAGERRRIVEPDPGAGSRSAESTAAGQRADGEAGDGEAGEGGTGAASAGPTSPDTAALHRAIEAALAGHRVPGGAVAVRYGDHAWTRGYGVRSLDGGGPVTPHTRFPIGSTGKQFTAAAVMMLVEEDELSVTDSLGTFFPPLPAAYHDVTIHQLLVHESGIPRDFKAGHSLVGEALLEALAHAPLDFAPGEGWSYSNTAFILLGMIVEQVSGRPLGRFLEERMFVPLGMDSTVFRRADSVEIDRATGYEGGMGKPRPVAFLPARFGAGSIVSTANDMARWARAMTTDEILTAESRLRMWLALTPDPERSITDVDGREFTVGYGWWVARESGRTVVYHGGSLDGYLSRLDHYPEHDLTVIVLLNNEGAREAITRIVRLVRDAFLEPSR